MGHNHSHGGGSHNHSHGGGSHNHGESHSSHNGNIESVSLNRVSRSGSLSTEKQNINVRAAFIHVLGDIVQSVGVLIAAYIIKFKVKTHICSPPSGRGGGVLKVYMTREVKWSFNIANPIKYVRLKFYTLTITSPKGIQDL